MNQYYLMAQLPSLDGIGDSMPLPITQERLYELCNRFLGKKAREELAKLTLIPPVKREKSSSALIEAWNTGERALRMALGTVRAAELGREFDAGDAVPSSALCELAKRAAVLGDPLEAENLLNRYRLEFLEGLRPADAFSEDTVYYYCLKLKLLLRIRQFDSEAGETAYRNIYHSILHGEGPEVTE